MTAPDLSRRLTTPQANPAEDVRPWVAPTPPAQPLSDPQEAAKWSRLRLRWFTAAGNGVDLVVGAGATSLAIVFERVEPNTDYGIILTPGWNTTGYVPVVDKHTTGFTARFGSAAPGGGSVCSYGIFRSED